MVENSIDWVTLVVGTFIQTAIAVLLIYYTHIRPKRVLENETATFFETYYGDLIKMLQRHPKKTSTS